MGSCSWIFGVDGFPIWVSSMYRGRAKQHPKILNPPGGFWEAKESGKGTGWGKQEWKLGEVGGWMREIQRVCNRERESMGSPGENKSHDIIVWQGARSGVATSRGREREKGETKAPTVTHSASRGPSSGMDKSRTMYSQWMGSQIPQEKNKSPVGKEEGEGEMEKETERWREKRRPLKRCAHKATKHLGTCRARQVETETKLPLYLLAGGWLGAKDLNMVAFTSELSNILIGPCNPSDDQWKGWINSRCVVCWVYMTRACGRQEQGFT